MVGRTLFALLVVTIGAGAHAMSATADPGASAMGKTPAVASAASGRPIVQVRDYSGSPTISVVAWSSDEPSYGLRASLRRDGSLIRDHQLYVSSSYLSSAGTERNVVQSLAPSGRVFRLTGTFRDDHPCDEAGICSPPTGFGMRVPDDVLRANRDSIAVRLYQGGHDVVISIDGRVIEPYLQTVDSLTAALRKK